MTEQARPSESKSSAGKSHDQPHQEGHSAGARLHEQSTRVLSDVKELGHVAMQEATGALHGVKERGHDALDAGKQRVGDARDGLEDYIRYRPLTSVLIAVGVGVLLGACARR